MHKVFNKVFSRPVINGILILLQAIFLFLLFYHLSEISLLVYFLLMFIDVLIALALLNNNLNPAFKMPWLLLLVVFPVLGVFMYLLNGKMWNRKKYSKNHFQLENYQNQEKDFLAEIFKMDKEVYGQAKYIYDHVNCPIYKNTTSQYYRIGEDMYEAMLTDLKNAKKFIFMEYFIIEKGYMWDSILEILLQKKEEGLDIRVIYDDIGCISKLPNNYYLELEKMGIPCISFNKFKPFLSIIYNNRDHRKILSIDGNIGYTGGINLADEYINRVDKFGHWKDTGIRLEGDAVASLTMSFLDTWSIFKEEKKSFQEYLPDNSVIKKGGYFIPYDDNPLKEEDVGATVYLNMINTATDYIYITTPYLILTYELILALVNASKRGVEVKIITPAIPDKWLVHAITQSYYPVLIQAGVEIYEYTPGFIHSKTFVCDDKIGIVGTINLDYRSLYHHYENAVWIYKDNVLKEMKKDFEETKEKCDFMDIQKYYNTPRYKRIAGAFAKALAPLM